MTTNRPLKVFLCHSSADKPAVRELYQKLCAEPWIEPWLDEEELFPGMDWNLEIEKAIEATDVILVCLSNNSITKEGYVQREIRIALDYADYKPEGTLFIIPIRLEECKPPKRLARWQYADYFEGQRKNSIERLLISLRRHSTLLGINDGLLRDDIKLSSKKTPIEIVSVTSKILDRQDKKKILDLYSWQGRSFAGLIFGFVVSVFAVIFTRGLLADNELFFMAFMCVLSGFIAYPHRLSWFILIASFFVIAMIIGTSPPTYGIDFFVSNVFEGAAVGFPIGAFITRSLYWLKVIK